MKPFILTISLLFEFACIGRKEMPCRRLEERDVPNMEWSFYSPLFLHEYPDAILGDWFFPCELCCDTGELDEYIYCEDMKYGQERNSWNFSSDGRLIIRKWDSYFNGRWSIERNDLDWKLEKRQDERGRDISYLTISNSSGVCLEGQIDSVDRWRTGMVLVEEKFPCFQYIDNADWHKGVCDYSGN